MKYFLDTDTCIYFLNGRYDNIAKNLQKIHPNNIKIASIVKAELLYAAKKSNFSKENLKKVSDFMFPLEVVSFCSNACEKYASTRLDLEKRGKIIGPNDLILASIVLAHKGVLITNNQKEFSRVKDLRSTNWI